MELVLFGQWNVDPLLEASQERRVDVPGTVRSTHQEDLLVTPVHLCQQLCLHPAGSKDRGEVTTYHSHQSCSTVAILRYVSHKCSFLLYLMKHTGHWNTFMNSRNWVVYLIAVPQAARRSIWDKINLVACDIMQFCRQVPMCWRCLEPPSLGCLSTKPLCHFF
jgi:hypothetical protein